MAYKTNFGPEETQDYTLYRIALANQKKTFLDQQLKAQIEVYYIKNYRPMQKENKEQKN